MHLLKTPLAPKNPNPLEALVRYPSFRQQEGLISVIFLVL